MYYQADIRIFNRNLQNFLFVKSNQQRSSMDYTVAWFSFLRKAPIFFVLLKANQLKSNLRLTCIWASKESAVCYIFTVTTSRKRPKRPLGESFSSINQSQSSLIMSCVDQAPWVTPKIKNWCRHLLQLATENFRHFFLFEDSFTWFEIPYKSVGHQGVFWCLFSFLSLWINRF